MISLRTVANSVLGDALSGPLTCSLDFSRYRKFQLGTTLPVVAEQMRVKSSEAKAIHERPAAIQAGAASSFHGLFAARGISERALGELF